MFDNIILKRPLAKKKDVIIANADRNPKKKAEEK